jgi:hypothetical protein
MTTETTSLINNWRQTDYSFLDECRECHLGALNYCLLGFQSVMTAGVFAGNMILLSRGTCKDSFNLAIGLSAGALTVNCVYLSLTCFLKARYSCCGAKPIFSEVYKIQREKCCYDTTIVLSSGYILANATTLFATALFCN